MSQQGRFLPNKMSTTNFFLSFSVHLNFFALYTKGLQETWSRHICKLLFWHQDAFLFMAARIYCIPQGPLFHTMLFLDCLLHCGRKFFAVLYKIGLHEKHQVWRSIKSRRPTWPIGHQAFGGISAGISCGAAWGVCRDPVDRHTLCGSHSSVAGRPWLPRWTFVSTFGFRMVARTFFRGLLWTTNHKHSKEAHFRISATRPLDKSLSLTPVIRYTRGYSFEVNCIKTITAIE